MRYYHITPIHNNEQIQKEGLKSDTGEIFLFTKRSIANKIASNQLMLESYSLFEIDPKGFEVKPVPDNVAEYTAISQRILLQRKIAPMYLKYLGDKRYNLFDMSEEQNLRIGHILYGKSMPRAKEYVESIVAGNEKWLKYYNSKYGKNLVLRAV